MVALHTRCTAASTSSGADGGAAGLAAQAQGEPRAHAGVGADRRPPWGPRSRASAAFVDASRSRSAASMAGVVPGGPAAGVVGGVGDDHEATGSLHLIQSDIERGKPGQQDVALIVDTPPDPLGEARRQRFIVIGDDEHARAGVRGVAPWKAVREADRQNASLALGGFHLARPKRPSAVPWWGRNQPSGSQRALRSALESRPPRPCTRHRVPVPAPDCRRGGSASSG